jgi:hypothetical protein
MPAGMRRGPFLNHNSTYGMPFHGISRTWLFSFGRKTRDDRSNARGRVSRPRRRCSLEKSALLSGVPHQPRVKGFGGEHGQDHDGAEGERPDPGLDRDHRAECDQRAEQ